MTSNRPDFNSVLLRKALGRFQGPFHGGEHEIYLGKVQKINFNVQQPFVFHRGQFGKVAHHDN